MQRMFHLEYELLASGHRSSSSHQPPGALSLVRTKLICLPTGVTWQQKLLKFQSLQGRWYSETKSVLEDESDDDTFIERNTHVTIKVSEKGLNQVVDFRVLGIYTKHYNKWYLCEQGRQPWSKEKTGNYKVYARMVSYDPSFDNHKAVSPIDSTHWWKKSIYVLCDSKKIEAIVGKFGPSLKKM